MGLGLGVWGHGHYSNPDRGLQNLNFFVQHFGQFWGPVLGASFGGQFWGKGLENS